MVFCIRVVLVDGSHPIGAVNPNQHTNIVVSGMPSVVHVPANLLTMINTGHFGKVLGRFLTETLGESQLLVLCIAGRRLFAADTGRYCVLQAVQRAATQFIVAKIENSAVFVDPT